MPGTRVIPHGDPRGSKIGICRLCGTYGNLSKTHVPARAAGNQGRARYAVEFIDANGLSTTGLGRATDGGTWGRWFCEGCNGRTGKWDEEFLRWATPNLVIEIQRAKVRPGENFFYDKIEGDPAAFVRSLWAWAFAVDSELRKELPDLANAVRTGVAADAPASQCRLLLGATADLRIWVARQRGGYAIRSHLSGWYRTSSGIDVPGSEFLTVPQVAVSAPPFVALLARSGDAPHAPYFDTGPWLTESVGSRRRVSIRLPIVKPFGDADVINLVTYEELAA